MQPNYRFHDLFPVMLNVFVEMNERTIRFSTLRIAALIFSFYGTGALDPVCESSGVLSPELSSHNPDVDSSVVV